MKVFKIFHTFAKEGAGFVRVRIMLSANSVILYSWSLICMLEIKFEEWIFWANGSINIIKMIGDRGHPCLVPFVMANGLEKTPSERTRAVGLEYKARMANNILL